MTWTVYVEYDGDVTAPDEARLRTAVGEVLRDHDYRLALDPLALSLVVPDYTEPHLAALYATAAFRHGCENAAVAVGVQPVLIECASGERSGWKPPELITHGGLAARYGVTTSWVRTLMGRKGAPEPVDVEGGAREAVYERRSALAWVGKELT
ncbi:hypothetical protein E6R60_26535 [Streptomyces sp. A0642]|uniref:hypothetical protein n=1 Tax=Streptomyces sp. A0642 TaxID=2563100 RepID=UPI0010A22A3D|nr:hypothetical protein [Streptomyces sp. A0642]THA72491.1 hypothetical protein E6R60_26535 [Streptomyces sp. A0642]